MEAPALIRVLADEGSVLVLDEDDRCGVISALATVSSRPVGMLHFGEHIKGELAAQTIASHLNKTIATGTPLLMLFSKKETADNVQPVLALLQRFVRLSGVCPILSLCASDAGVIAEKLISFADFRIYASGIHENTSSDIQSLDILAAVEKMRSLLYCLPLNCAENAPVAECGGKAKRGEITQLVDFGSVVEIYKDANAAISFARFSGRSCGYLTTTSGILPDGAARFIQFCDCYSLPVVIASEGELSLDALQLFILAQMTGTKVLIGQSVHETAFDLVISESDDRDSLRDTLIKALDYFSVKRDVLPPRKHGNLPL